MLLKPLEKAIIDTILEAYKFSETEEIQRLKTSYSLSAWITQFRTVEISVPRRSGKSTVASWLPDLFWFKEATLLVPALHMLDALKGSKYAKSFSLNQLKTSVLRGLKLDLVVVDETYKGCKVLEELMPSLNNESFVVILKTPYG